MSTTRVPDKLDKLDDDELLQLWTKVGEEAAERKSVAQRLAREYERRVELQQARDRIAGMSDSQRAALAQVAAAEGIETQERVS